MESRRAELRGMLPLPEWEPAADAQFWLGAVISSGAAGGAGLRWSWAGKDTTKSGLHRWLNIVVAWQEVRIECCAVQCSAVLCWAGLG